MADDDPRGWDAGALGEALQRWAADASAAEAAAARVRERWLRQQAGEEATLTGVLVDLAERGDTVTVTTRTGSHTGRLVGVGRDFCVVAGRASVILAHPAVVSVGVALPEAVARPTSVTGSRGAPMALDLAAVLALLASERTPVRLVLSGGDVVTGALEIAGEGIVQCRSAGPGRRSVTVVSAAIESCTPA